MVADIFRDSTCGQLVNYLSGGRLLPYRDQRPGYVVPARYLPLTERRNDENGSTEDATTDGRSGHQTLVDDATGATGQELHRTGDPKLYQKEDAALAAAEMGGIRRDSQPEGERYPWLVTWDEEDPDRPLKYSRVKRLYIGALVTVQTLAVYLGSAIYTPAVAGVTAHFGCSETVALLGLTLFVAAYGIAPIFLSPLQELPTWGRNPVYIVGFAIFLVLQIPCILAPNVACLLVFRFLSSFAGAPCLASGGASMGDVFGPEYLSVAIGAWSIGAICGPIFGPVLGSWVAQEENWRWPFLELVWFGGPVFLASFFTLPETLESTILVRRARRLRLLTGNDKLKAPAELDGSTDQFITSSMARTIKRAFRLAIEASLLVCHLYTALIYSVMYLWFEAFPILFQDMHGFRLGVSGLAYLAFIAATFIIFPVYCLYHLKYFQPRLKRNPDTPPEARLEFALMAGPFVPISLFWFGWTASPSIPWIVPLVGASLYTAAIYILFQQILVYISLSYPQYAASILAGNALFRSVTASVFPLFGHAFFSNLGMGPACSILAGVSILMVALLYLIMISGDSLRKRSKFTG